MLCTTQTILCFMENNKMSTLIIAILFVGILMSSTTNPFITPTAKNIVVFIILCFSIFAYGMAAYQFLNGKSNSSE